MKKELWAFLASSGTRVPLNNEHDIHKNAQAYIMAMLNELLIVKILFVFRPIIIGRISANTRQILEQTSP